MWNDYRDTGRTVEVYSDVGWSILNPDGSYQAAGHRIHGDFRLCRAPGAIGGASPRRHRRRRRESAWRLIQAAAPARCGANMSSIARRIR